MEGKAKEEGKEAVGVGKEEAAVKDEEERGRGEEGRGAKVVGGSDKWWDPPHKSIHMCQQR